MEVDEIVPGMQPSSKETDGGSKQHVSKSKVQKEE